MQKGDKVQILKSIWYCGLQKAIDDGIVFIGTVQWVDSSMVRVIDISINGDGGIYVTNDVDLLELKRYSYQEAVQNCKVIEG
jgi:hypothetical protein